MVDKKIFISYAHKDKELVDKIHDYLKSQKCEMFFDNVSILSGINFIDEIENNIINASCVIAFVTKDYLVSDYCKKEIEIANNNSISIHPFSIEDGLSSSDISALFGSVSSYPLFNLIEIEQIDYVYRFLLFKYPGAFENKDEIVFENAEKRILINVRDEKNLSGGFDQIAEIISHTINSSRRLFAFDTPSGLNISITKHNSSTLNDEYFNNDNNPIYFSALFEVKNQSTNKHLASFICYFIIINPSLENAETKLVDVKVISPFTNKYEKNETIDEMILKAANDDELLGVLKSIKEKLIEKIESNGGDHNCLERKSKKTELLTVEEIFREPNCYRIPDYQRGYAWRTNTKKVKAEFKELWEDILRVYNGKTDDKSHYTGMLALKEMTPDQKQFEGLVYKNAFDVVDGQQRLTSIVIILESIRWFLFKCGVNVPSMFELDRSLRMYRFNYSKKRNPEEIRFFTERIYENGNPNVTKLDSYLRDIDEAKKMVDEELKKYSEEEILNICEVILNRLIFNIYFVSKEFDVRVTFETMNNRGKKLTNLELLKNRLMYLTSFVDGYEAQLIDLININWKVIYDNISIDDSNERDDEYLQAHWNVYKPFVKGRSERYKEELLEEEFSLDGGAFYPLIQSGAFEKAKDHIANYVNSLAKYSKAWKIIHNPLDNNGLTPEEQKALDKLNRIVSMQYVKPAVMAVCGEDDRTISTAKKIEFYEALEIALFIVRLMGLNSDNTFSDICSAACPLLLKGDKIKKMNDLIKACRNIENCFTKQRQLDAIKKLGDNLNKYSKRGQLFYKWPGIEYVLYEYESALSLLTNYNGLKQLSWKMIDKKSVEHILPQNISNGYWQLALSKITGQTRPEEIKRLQNSIGNLLLLSGQENSTVKNYSFKTKKDASVESMHYSYMYGTRAEQQVASYDIWSPYEIHNRETKLLTFIYNNWIAKTQSNLTLAEFLASTVAANLTTKAYNPPSAQFKNSLLRFDNSNERVGTAHVSTQSQESIEFEQKIKPYFELKGAALGWPKNKTIGKYYFKLHTDWIWARVLDKQNNIHEFVYERLTNELKLFFNSKAIYNINSIANDESLYFINTFIRILRLEYGITLKPIVYEPSVMEYKSIKKSRIVLESDFRNVLNAKSLEMAATFDNLMNLIKTQIPNLKFYFTNELMGMKMNTKGKTIFAELLVHSKCISVHIKAFPTNHYGFDIRDVNRFKQFYINESSDLQEVCDIIREISLL